MRPLCLIVGAGPGIGQSVAQAFAREGYDLALAARHPARLAEFRLELDQAGAEPLVADFRVNVAGALLCAQEAATGMKDRGRGTILLTGGGFVQSGTQYDPARIADAYVRLHPQAPEHFQTELVFK